MTKDEIIRMARECINADSDQVTAEYPYWRDMDILRFAAMVADAQREACRRYVTEFAAEATTFT